MAGSKVHYRDVNAEENGHWSGADLHLPFVLWLLSTSAGISFIPKTDLTELNNFCKKNSDKNYCQEVYPAEDDELVLGDVVEERVGKWSGLWGILAARGTRRRKLCRATRNFCSAFDALCGHFHNVILPPTPSLVEWIQNWWILFQTNSIEILGGKNWNFKYFFYILTNFIWVPFDCPWTALHLGFWVQVDRTKHSVAKWRKFDFGSQRHLPVHLTFLQFYGRKPYLIELGSKDSR